MLGTLGIDPNKRLHHFKHKHQTLFRQSSLGFLLCFLALAEQVQHLGLDFEKSLKWLKNTTVNMNKQQLASKIWESTKPNAF
jgi:hypothetical protein